MRTHMIALPTRAHTPQGDSCWHLGASVSNFSLEQSPLTSPRSALGLQTLSRWNWTALDLRFWWQMPSRCSSASATLTTQNTGQVSLGSAVAVLENHILRVWLPKDGAAGTSLPRLSVLGGHCSNLGTLAESMKGKKEDASLSCLCDKDLGTSNTWVF